MSHPTWVRGLKLGSEQSCVHALVSHPTWVRGLKHIGFQHTVLSTLSHPTWVRGLKLQVFFVKSETFFVAPYVGAWIETRRY